MWPSSEHPDEGGDQNGNKTETKTLREKMEDKTKGRHRDYSLGQVFCHNRCRKEHGAVDKRNRL